MVGWSNEAKGSALAMFGSVLAAPDFVLMRLALAQGATEPVVIVWKCLAMSCFAFCAARYASHKEARWSLIHDAQYVLGLAATRALVNICLSSAFMLTYAANANLFFSTNGLITAALGRVMLNEPALPLKTQLALVGATAAIAGMTVPDVLSNGHDSGSFGDELALAAAVFLSLNFVLARKAPPEVCVPFATACGTVLAALVTALYGWSVGLDVLAGASPRFFGLVAADGACVGILIVAFAIAPRYITGAKIGLIGLSQNILSPLGAWLVFGEVPPLPTLLGGFCVLVIVTIHEWWAVRQASNQVGGNGTKKSFPVATVTTPLNAKYQELVLQPPSTSSSELLVPSAV